MSRQQEYVNPAGFRTDGRRPHELRQARIQLGIISGVDGSCELSSGRSKTCATVIGPKESSNRLDKKYGELSVSCEVAIAAFASDTRFKPRRRSNLSDEISAAVEQVARSVIVLSQYPNSQIHIYVEIIQRDGSEKVASINAALLALADANIAMYDVVTCVDAGMTDDAVLVDLTDFELRSQCPVITAAFLGHDPERIVWLEATSRLTDTVSEYLMKAAQRSATILFRDTIEPALRSNAHLSITAQR